MSLLHVGRSALKSLVPHAFLDAARWGWQLPGRLVLSGGGYFCPVCERHARAFLPYGFDDLRLNARCPHCDALERHRLTWLFLRRMTNLFDGDPKCVLHVAPERMFQKRLRKLLGSGYVSGDLYNPRAMVRMDITDIPFGEGTFDAVYCSHVLEHVQNDRLAMQELRRVLKPEGWALLLVPISADQTFEDPGITDPVQRERIFGQADHVRRYGPDYEDRLVEAGFLVQRFAPERFVSAQEIETMGLPRKDCDMYLCSRAVAAGT